MGNCTRILLAWLGTNIPFSHLAVASDCRYTLRPMAVLDAPRDKAGSVAISPDGRTVACGDRDGTVYVWDTASHKLRRELSARTDRSESRLLVDALMFSRDGRLLLVSTSDENVMSFRTADYRRQHVWRLRNSFDLSSRDELLLDHPSELVSPYNGAKLRNLPVASGVDRLSRDNKLLATSGWNKEVTLRSAKDGAVIAVAKVGDEITDNNTSLIGVQFSADGSWLGAYNGYHGQSFIWSLADVSHPKLVRSLQSMHYVFLPDNRVAYSDHDDTTNEDRVSVIDLRTGILIGCLVPPRGETTGGAAHVATTPSGRWLAAPLYDSSKVYVWDLQQLLQDGPSASPPGDQIHCKTPEWQPFSKALEVRCQAPQIEDSSICRSLLARFEQCDPASTNPGIKLSPISRTIIKTRRQFVYTVVGDGEYWELFFKKAHDVWVVERVETATYE